MSNDLSAIDEVRGTLGRMVPQFKLALPSHITSDKFNRIVMTVLQNNPSLLEKDRTSLYSACMQAAQDGLLPDGRDAALVPFKDRVKYLVMVSGLLKKIRNSGELKEISAEVVYRDDIFVYTLGDDARITHERNLSSDNQTDADIMLVYAIAKTLDGGVYREVMTRSQVEQVRGVSRAKDDGPWVYWWAEMAKKSVVRRLSKRLPMSSDMESLIRRDDEDTDFVQERAPAKTRMQALIERDKVGAIDGVVEVTGDPL